MKSIVSRSSNQELQCQKKHFECRLWAIYTWVKTSHCFKSIVMYRLQNCLSCLFSEGQSHAVSFYGHCSQSEVAVLYLYIIETSFTFNDLFPCRCMCELHNGCRLARSRWDASSANRTIVKPHLVACVPSVSEQLCRVFRHVCALCHYTWTQLKK